MVAVAALMFNYVCAGYFFDKNHIAGFSPRTNIVYDAIYFIKEVTSTNVIEHQCSYSHHPRSLLISKQEAEKWEQHIEHKNDSQCPAHTDDRNICIWQKSLAQGQICKHFIQRVLARRDHKI